MSTETSLEPQANGEFYRPSADIVARANVPIWEAKSTRAQNDLTGFWAERALELEWYKPWDTVLDETNKPFYKWFAGGKVNIVHNCLDRHVKTWRRNKLALIWEGEPGDQRTFSYHALNREVSKFATAVRGLMRFGEAWPNRHDLSSLRLLGSVGEPINPEAWKWYHRVIGKGNCPVTESFGLPFRFG